VRLEPLLQLYCADINEWQKNGTPVVVVSALCRNVAAIALSFCHTRHCNFSAIYFCGTSKDIVEELTVPELLKDCYAILNAACCAIYILAFALQLNRQRFDNLLNGVHDFQC